MDASEDRGFDDFVRGRSTALLRTSYLLTGDRGAAEDLLQGVLERVARRWTSIANSPDAYVHRALTNAAVNRWRRRRPADLPLLDSDHPSTPDSSDIIAVRDQLIRGLMSLPARQRAVLVLRYFDDLTEAETAHALGCSIGTVKSQASRGLGRLRALVDGHDVTPANARSPR